MLIPIRDHNPSHRRPYVTWALVAVNIAVFVLFNLGAEDEEALYDLFYTWGMLPISLSGGDGWGTLLTHQFLHGDILHLGSNMLFLWIFGDNLEDALGHWKFLGFYLLSGLGAAALQYGADPQSMIPMVGASGAIAGVLGGYLLLYPRARIDLFLFLIVIFRIIPMPAWLVLGTWFGLQILGGVGEPGDGGGVAYWAHAGGFIAGLVLIWPLWQRLGGRAFWSRCLMQPPHPEATYRFTQSSIPRAGRGANAKPSPWRR
jgi:membrane associated rhomboid family serine protease